MIYLVDEDVNQLSAFAEELRFRGYSVLQIDNADSAYDSLLAAQDIELVIVDVMLGTADPEISRFTREKTMDFLTTGLSLLDDLFFVDAQKFRNKVILFSMTSTPNLLQVVQRASQQYSAPFLRKRDYVSPFSFGERVQAILSGNGHFNI